MPEEDEDTLAYSKFPWDYQPWETWRAYECFQTYRDMGQRTKADVAEIHGVPKNTVYNWARENSWDERVEEYDKHNDKIARQRNRNNLVQAREQTAEIAGTLADQFYEYVEWLEQQDAEVRRERFDDLTLKEFVQSLERLHEIQETAHGAEDHEEAEDSVLEKLADKVEERRREEAQERTIKGDVKDAGSNSKDEPEVEDREPAGALPNGKS